MQVYLTALKYTQKLIPLTLSDAQYIMLHHIAAESATTEQIHEWHIANKWAGFGYNEYIRKDGTVYIGRGDHIGAHCAGMNSKSYGIAVEGNYNVEKKMPQAQLDSLIERIKVNKRRFTNFKCTVPHGKFYPTSCPGEYFPLAEVISKSEMENEPMEVPVKQVDEKFKENLELLQSYGKISSPDYWLTNVNSDGNVTVRGEYLKAVFASYAELVKSWY